ncbi:hypothetical protein KW789_01680 [Candidatus Saccharibacteria bacterium]|jgi:hypothetical protein|nr:hypothetical protein [Candidatus Saccharibacteria bacterium]
MESLDFVVLSAEGQINRKPNPKAIAKMLELALAPEPPPKPAPKPH